MRNSGLFRARLIFLIVVVGSLLSISALAQEKPMAIFDDFSGGLNTKLSAFNLPPKQGDIAENVRYDSVLKSISKRQNTVVYGTVTPSTEAILGMHRLYLDDGTKKLIVNHGDQIDVGDDSDGSFTSILALSTGDRRWQWLTWHELAIGTDGYNQPVKYDGDASTASYLGSAVAVDAGEGAGPDGTYSYKISCYTATYTTILDTPSNEVTVVDNDIDLTQIPICPSTYLGEAIVGRKVYRNTVAAQTTWQLLTNGTIADNSTLTLTDSDADGALGANYPTVDNATIFEDSPPKGKLILLHKNRLWIANNPDNPSRLYYSEDGLHDIFIADAYLNIRVSDGDEITFIKNLLGKLTVGKNNTIQKVYTDDTDPDAWSISDPFSFVGCQAPYSVVNSPLGILYLSNNGIYAFNGQYSELVSDAVTPEIKDITTTNYQNVWGELYNNSYYMAYASNRTGSAINNRVLVLDILTNAYSLDTLSANAFLTLKSGSDIEVLYYGSSTEGKVYASEQTAKTIIHATHDDFAGTFDSMRYIPVAVGGNADSPILELSRTGTIDELVGTIDSLTGTIDRSQTTGTYTSQYLTINSSAFDKIYWNEEMPTAGGDVTFSLRSAATTTDCLTTAWSSEVSDPSGSDISGVTADTIAQYKISMSTNDITQTPTIVKLDNYNVKIVFNVAGTSDETTVPFTWRSGWLDMKPGYKKTLKKMTVYYDYPEDTAGTLNVTWENYEGDTDLFAIDLEENPGQYTEYFSGGAFLGELFRFKFTETSLNSLTINKMVVYFDVEPLY